MDQFKAREHSPIASLQADLVALNHNVLAQRQRQLEEEVNTLNFQARLNRMNGALSDLVQRIELAAGKQPTPIRDGHENAPLLTQKGA